MQSVYFTLFIIYHFILECMGRKFTCIVHHGIPIMKNSVWHIAGVQLVFGE